MSHSALIRFVGAMAVLGALAGGPGAIAGKVYWSVNDVALQRANLDGTNVENVIVGFTRGIAIDTVDRKIYWGQDNDEQFTLRRANLDGSAVEIVVDFGAAEFFIPLALDREGGKIYMGMSFFEGCLGIRRYNLDGSNGQNVVSGICADTIAVDPEGGKLYWAEGSAIRRANLNGSNPETVVLADEGVPGIAVHPEQGKIYWTQPGPPNVVQRANTDGSNVETLIASDEHASSIALDTLGGKMYWAEQVPQGRILRADLDGSNPEVILAVDTPWQIAVDPLVNGSDVPAVSWPGAAVIVTSILLLTAAAMKRRRRGPRAATGRE